ncbi:hypothetical protein Y695_04765 [Hydrogenophaga sp. T4]|nr:hypothetical protein Y695_04765 [Hydrogenophaga sp. T4]
MPTYMRRRSSCRRCARLSALASRLLSSSILNGSKPSFTPTSITCGHSRPFDACRVESVTTFWSFSRSESVESRAMVCTTSSRVLRSVSVCTPASSSIWPPQRPATQSQNSTTLVQRAAATFSLSSLSYRCFS